MRLRDSYGNSSRSGFTIDFFSLSAVGATDALLASPFFTTYEPVKLLTARGCRVSLIVRLCEITTPQALKEAMADPLVSVRYFTGQSFHAKFYIVDDVALVGSANLTNSGLKANREVSVVLHRGRDMAFEDLPGLFDLLWEYADVLTPSILSQYETAFRDRSRPKGDEEFQEFIEKVIDPCSPPNIRVGSDRVTKRRSFLQKFRRKYDELLAPAFTEVSSVFSQFEQRRPEFSAGDSLIEISRLLGWIRVAHAPGESWREGPLLSPSERATRVSSYVKLWLDESEIKFGDMIHAEREIENIAAIRNNFRDRGSINALSYEELFRTLSGCHAFVEMLRFTKGGLSGLSTDFEKRNSLVDIKSTLTYLFHGAGDPLARAYDCIYDEQYKLERFGEACVMELVGWMTPSRPPINGRTIKALRFLGFDVGPLSSEQTLDDMF